MDKIKFISESHKYYYGDRQLISVSEFTERFKQKQNWEQILQKKAKSLGISRDELKRQWDNKSKMSILAGNTLHLEKELTLANKEFEEFYSCKCKIKQCEFDGEAKYSIPINQLENNTAYPELMIYDLEHGICGQSDKVIVVDNTIHVVDFKTDKEISFKGYSNQFMKARKLLKPIDHLDECNGNIYSIKMSLYMYMLWKANKGNLKPGELVIEHVHLKRNDEGYPIFEEGKPVILKEEMIKIPYRKREVEALLKHL